MENSSEKHQNDAMSTTVKNSEPIVHYTIRATNFDEEVSKINDQLIARKNEVLWPCNLDEPDTEDEVADLTLQESPPRSRPRPRPRRQTDRRPIDPKKRAILDAYYQQVNESEGFRVSPSVSDRTPLLSRFEAFPVDRKSLTDAAKYAIQVYNNNQKGEEALELKRIVRVTGVESIMFYLTLEATNGNFYETIIRWDLSNPEEENVKEFRPALFYPSLPNIP